MIKILLVGSFVAAFGQACTDDEVLGAWVECRNEQCTQYDGEGVIFQDNGFAFLIVVDNQVAPADMTFCVDVIDPGMPWKREGETVVVSVRKDGIIQGSATITDDRLTIQGDANSDYLSRIDEENRTGACAPNQRP
jgi:hypothetical protein